jgi:hypothetical protein
VDDVRALHEELALHEQPVENGEDDVAVPRLEPLSEGHLVIRGLEPEQVKENHQALHRRIHVLEVVVLLLLLVVRGDVLEDLVQELCESAPGW